MSTKGKGGKKDKGKSNKMTRVDQTFYELELTAAKQKLANARIQINELQKANDELQALYNDNAAVEERLQLIRNMATSNLKLAQMELKLKELKDRKLDDDREFLQFRDDFEKKYKMMHDQLTTEIKMLTGKLNTLQEFYLNRGELLHRMENQEASFQAQKMELQQAVYDTEYEMRMKLDELTKDMAANLQIMAEDWTKINTMKQGAYFKQLARENISLRKELDAMISSYFDLKTKYQELENKTRHVREDNVVLHEQQRVLLTNTQSKLHLIKNLTHNYEKLKERFIEASKYKELYSKIMIRNDCYYKKERKNLKRFRHLAAQVEHLRTDKANLIATCQKQNNQIVILRGLMTQVKDAINSASQKSSKPRKTDKKTTKVRIRSPSPKVFSKVTTTKSDRTTALEEQRKQLMSVLTNILCNYRENDLNMTVSQETIECPEPHTYLPGKAGLVPIHKPSLMEIFKCVGHKGDNWSMKSSMTSIDSAARQYQLQTNMIVPKARKVDNVMLDVEAGSSLYVSSSVVEDDKQEEADNPEEMGEEETESDDDYQISDEPTEPTKE